LPRSLEDNAALAGTVASIMREKGYLESATKKL
jgi:hypothetical protein